MEKNNFQNDFIFDWTKKFNSDLPKSKTSEYMNINTSLNVLPNSENNIIMIYNDSQAISEIIIDNDKYKNSE